MTIPVVAGPAVAPGRYLMRIKGIKINDGSIEHELADVTCTITVNKREVNDAFAAGDVSVMQGSTVPVPVSMANAIKACGFQCDITMPDGLSIAKDSNGKSMVKLTSRASDHVAATSTLANGDVRLLVYSMSNTPFSGTGGELFSIPVVATESTPGEYTMKISNFRLSDALGYEEKMAEVTCKITVTTNVGAAGIEDDDIKVLAHDGNITIVGAKVGEMVAVYDITGRMIGNAVATEAETVTLAIGVNGVYVVRIGNDIKRVVALK